MKGRGTSGVFLGCPAGSLGLPAAMGKDKPGSQMAQSKIDKFGTQMATGTQKMSWAEHERAIETGMAAETLKAIHESRIALERQIGGVQSEVILLRQDLRNTVDRVTEAEGHISELEDSVQNLTKTLPQVSAMAKTLEVCTEDAENRARRNNLRFVGFEEGLEDGGAY